jgi:hypothetical protein
MSDYASLEFDIKWDNTKTVSVLQLNGQTNVPYVLQSSTNMIDWFSVSTNMLPGSALNVTNSIQTGAIQKFWRAVWHP